MLLEERAGGGIVDVAGHDVPGDRLAGVARVGQQLLGEHLKQRLVLDRRDGIFALGPVVPEPRALPAGDEKRADFSLCEQLPPAHLRVEIELAMLRPGQARNAFTGSICCGSGAGAFAFTCVSISSAIASRSSDWSCDLSFCFPASGSALKNRRAGD